MVGAGSVLCATCMSSCAPRTATARCFSSQLQDNLSVEGLSLRLRNVKKSHHSETVGIAPSTPLLPSGISSSVAEV